MGERNDDLPEIALDDVVRGGAKAMAQKRPTSPSSLAEELGLDLDDPLSVLGEEPQAQATSSPAEAFDVDFDDSPTPPPPPPEAEISLSDALEPESQHDSEVELQSDLELTIDEEVGADVDVDVELDSQPAPQLAPPLLTGGPLIAEKAGESTWDPTPVAKRRTEATAAPLVVVSGQGAHDSPPPLEADAEGLDALLADIETSAQDVAAEPFGIDEVAPELPDPSHDELGLEGLGELEGAGASEPGLGDPFVVTPDDPDAPPLPISADEPPPVSRVPASALMPDPATFENLRRLAGAGAEPEAARDALMAAVLGDTYDVHAIPDARVIALGLARALVERGAVDAVALVSAIMAVLEE